MKTKLIFVFCLLLSLLSFGQGTYKSFIHSGVTKWLYYSPQDGCSMSEVDAYSDTIINQLTYKKLWDTYFVAQPPYVNVNQQWRDYSQFSNLTNFFIRQSDDSAKLYLLDGTNNIEYLIADMNLKVGDEFIFPILGSDTVASIIYENGLKKILFKTLKAAWDELTLIEGVGVNRDLYRLIMGYGEYASILICYSNNSYFFNLDNYTCACIDTKTKDISTNKYQIKKLSDLIEISFDRIAQRSWEVFDIHGREVQKSSITSKQSIQIPIFDLRNGIYLLRIYNLDNKEYESLKITL
jgi:hypothetical protein